MPKFLIDEASRRGREEAQRRELQHSIDTAYSAEVDKYRRKRQREQERAQARERVKENLSRASHNLFYALFNIGWFAACAAIAYTKAWEEIPALDDFFWDMEWLGYLSVAVIYFLGRRFTLDLLGYTERR